MNNANLKNFSFTTKNSNQIPESEFSIRSLFDNLKNLSFKNTEGDLEYNIFDEE